MRFQNTLHYQDFAFLTNRWFFWKTRSLSFRNSLKLTKNLLIRNSSQGLDWEGLGCGDCVLEHRLNGSLKDTSFSDAQERSKEDRIERGNYNYFGLSADSKLRLIVETPSPYWLRATARYSPRSPVTTLFISSRAI